MYEKEIKDIIREFPDRAIRWLLETPENIRGLLSIIVEDLAKRIDYSKIQRLDRTFMVIFLIL